MSRRAGAVAVDLGASSGRFAEGWLDNDGQIQFRVIKQIPHSSLGDHPATWDFSTLLGLCQEAADFAQESGGASLAIDTWGVDHGFLDADGKLLQPVVCYRDLSHQTQFDALRELRSELFRLTGIQHQPFNTIYQLAARKMEDPSIVDRRWLLLPDLLGYFLSGDLRYEATQSSTTQLMGLDDRWCEDAFRMIGWPIPDRQPEFPGSLGGLVGPGVRLAAVGSHDTASAVAGFGSLASDVLFANIGTWSLAGVVVDRPVVTPEAERLGFTNERTVDGRVRLLRNIPGFYVVNRLHEELGIEATVPLWLASAEQTDARLDLFDERFFNPESMVEACLGQLSSPPQSPAEWAGIVLFSLAEAVASQTTSCAQVTGVPVTSIRVGGGGSNSQALCQAIADISGLPVSAGPVEATLVGNLALQFKAQGHFADWAEMARAIEASISLKTYHPGGGA